MPLIPLAQPRHLKWWQAELVTRHWGHVGTWAVAGRGMQGLEPSQGQRSYTGLVRGSRGLAGGIGTSSRRAGIPPVHFTLKLGANNAFNW